MQLQRLYKWIKSWWKGEFIPDKNDPNSPFVFLSGVMRRHWTSRLLHVLVAFYLREWKWIWVFLVAVAGVCVTVAGLKG